MHVITVSPITKFDFKDGISYFSNSNFTPGEFVKVQIKNRDEYAIVMSVKTVDQSKQSIRGSEYTLKKITDTKSIKVFTEGFIKAAARISEEYSVSIGTVVYHYAPSFAFDFPIPIQDRVSKKSNLVTENLYLEDNFQNRIEFYKKYLRECFAKNESVMIVVPNSILSIIIGNELSHGLENFLYVLNSEISKSTQKKIWEKIITNKKPVALICTPTFISVPRDDFNTFIIESEYETFKRLFKPFISAKQLLEYLSLNTNSKLINSGMVLSYESRLKIANKELYPTPANSRPRRSMRQIEKKIVDLSSADTKEFVFQKNILEEIKSQNLDNNKIAIFCSRKGLSPMTICADCGEVYTCPKCEVPLVQKRTKGKFIFYCNKCLKESSTEVRCRKCDSWKLYGYGYGIDKISKEVEKVIDKRHIFVIDKGKSPTKKALFNQISEFLNSESGVLICTLITIPYLMGKDIDHVYIASFDNLLTIPDFSLKERLLCNLSEISDITSKSLSILTKMPEEPLFQAIIKGRYDEFIKSELNKRKLYNFPPYSVLVTVTRSGKKEVAGRDIAILKDKLSQHKPLMINGPIDKKKYSLVLQIPLDNWPNYSLSGILGSLPQNYEVNIHAQSFL